MEVTAQLEAAVHTLKVFRRPSVHVQRVAQALLLLLGKRAASECGVWRWEDVRARLRERSLLPLLAAFDPRRVDAATAVAASKTLKSLSAERVARVSAPVAQVFRWCATALKSVEAALDDGPTAETRGPVEQTVSDSEDEYADDDFDEHGSERQIGDEEDASDRALWRQQQASTVLSGDFDYSILDGAMVSMVVKFLGAGHSALLLQTKALEALTARLRSAPSQTAEKASCGSNDDEGEDEVETLGAVMSSICKSGGVQRCVSLLGAASLPTRMLAANLLGALLRQSADAAAIFKSCGGEVADQAGCFDALQWTEEDSSKPVELGTATTILSGEGASQCWGLDLTSDIVVASSTFVADHGEGIPLAEGMVCAGFVEGGPRRGKPLTGCPVQGAQLAAVAEKLACGLDLWNGQRLCLLLWERSLLLPPGEEDSSDDSALWRSQVAQTVEEGAFAWEALDEAMLGSVLKYLGSGVTVVQTQAAAALRRRLGDDELNNGAEAVAVAAGIVSGGGLHRLVDWLASEKPQLRVEGARTLRMLISRSAPEEVLDAVVALAVGLGGQTVLELLDHTKVPQGRNKRGYTTINVGIAGARNLWGLRVSHDGVVREVASGSVAATSLVHSQGLRLVSVSGYPASRYGGSLRDSLEAAAAGILAVDNNWKGTRLLQVVVHEVEWISNHLSKTGCNRCAEMCDVSAYAYGEKVVRTWRANANGQLGY